MRKLSIILALAFLATIGFSSCGEKSLKGTSWKTDVVNSEYDIFRFTTDSKCSVELYSDNDLDVVETGTYTYNHPNVTIDCGIDLIFTGSVSGNKMTLLNDDGFTVIATKQ